MCSVLVPYVEAAFVTLLHAECMVHRKALSAECTNCNRAVCRWCHSCWAACRWRSNLQIRSHSVDSQIVLCNFGDFTNLQIAWNSSMCFCCCSRILLLLHLEVSRHLTYGPPIIDSISVVWGRNYLQTFICCLSKQWHHQKGNTWIIWYPECRTLLS